MKNVEEIEKICKSKLKDLGLDCYEYLDKLDDELEDLKLHVQHGSKNIGASLLARYKTKTKPRKSNKSASLVLYLLNLSTLDPIKEGLRAPKKVLVQGDCPDIDTDFDPRFRDAVKENIVKMFGEEKVCSIGSYQTFKTKGSIVDVARTLGLDVSEVYKMTTEMDALASHEVGDDDEEKKLDKMTFDEVCEVYPKVGMYFNKYPEVRFHAEVIRNQVSAMSTHAGGVIISNLNLQDKIPVQKDKSGKVVSCWTEGISGAELSSVGLVKFDILGLSNLSIIDECVKQIEKTRGLKLKDADIPINDTEAIRESSRNDLVGIFQFESPATKPVADAVKMESLNDLSAVTALIRPGPKNMGMHMEYAERKNGLMYNNLPECGDFMDETYDVLAYQEQIMLASKKLAGFTGVEANKLRKGIGKKIPEVIAMFRQKFLDGCAKVGLVNEKEADFIWQNIESAGAYSFNKSHSVAYSAISAKELHLKYHYPVEYMTALMNTCSGTAKKNFTGSNTLLAYYIGYCRKKDITVLPPCINRSGNDFRVEGKNIRFSLSHIKKVGASAPTIEEHQPFSSMNDFIDRTFTLTKTTGKRRKLTKGVIEALITAGAFDCFHNGDRNEILKEFYAIRKNKKDVFEEAPISIWQELEKESLGICLSKRPIAMKYYDTIKSKGLELLGDLGRFSNRRFFGRIEYRSKNRSKAGNDYYKITFTDDIDSIEFFVWQSSMKEFDSQTKLGGMYGICLDAFAVENADGINKKDLQGLRFYNSKHPIIQIREVE